MLCALDLINDLTVFHHLYSTGKDWYYSFMKRNADKMTPGTPMQLSKQDNLILEQDPDPTVCFQKIWLDLDLDRSSSSSQIGD